MLKFYNSLLRGPCDPTLYILRPSPISTPYILHLTPYTLERVTRGEQVVHVTRKSRVSIRPGGNLATIFQSISHRCYLQEVAFEWKVSKATIYLPLGCLQGGLTFAAALRR